LARDWCDTAADLGREQREIEAKALFGLTPEKVKQIARALRVWEQVGGVLGQRRVQLNRDQEEQVLQQVWPVLLATGSLTMTDAVRYCVTDAVEQVLLRIGGASVSACKNKIVAERFARQSKQRPTRRSIFGRMVGDNAEEVPHRRRPGVAGAVFITGAQSRKRRGMAAEKKVARDLGGRLVPGSGCGAQKGDVVADGLRVEVKLTQGRRWRLPVWQLRQLTREALRHGEVPAVVFSTPKGPVAAMVPIATVAHLPHEVVGRRTVSERAKYFSLPLATTTVITSSTKISVLLVDVAGGRWAIGNYDLIVSGVDGNDGPAEPDDIHQAPRSRT
jgi:hypothetical protein